MKHLVLILCCVWIFAGCAGAPEVVEPTLYEKYEDRASELREMVREGYLGVAEAEELRQKAFSDYLDELKLYRLEREKRNY